MPGNGALVFIMQTPFLEIRYYAGVSFLEDQERRSHIFNLFLGCVNFLRVSMAMALPETILTSGGASYSFIHALSMSASESAEPENVGPMIRSGFSGF